MIVCPIREARGPLDPVSAIALSLALGAGTTAGKAVVTEIVKDAYAALKRLIKDRYPTVSVEQLEAAPESKMRRGVIEEDLTKLGADKDPELLAAAQRLSDAVQRQAPALAASIGIDLKDLEAANVRLRDITASGTGVRMEGAKLSGDLDIEGVRAGPSAASDDSSKKN